MELSRSLLITDDKNVLFLTVLFIVVFVVRTFALYESESEDGFCSAIYCSSQCSTTGVTKVVVCAILSGMVHIKDPLLLIGKSSPCGGSRFPLSLSEWSSTICPTPYNCK